MSPCSQLQEVSLHDHPSSRIVILPDRELYSSNCYWKAVVLQNAVFTKVRCCDWLLEDHGVACHILFISLWNSTLVSSKQSQREQQHRNVPTGQEGPCLYIKNWCILIKLHPMYTSKIFYLTSPYQDILEGNVDSSVDWCFAYCIRIMRIIWRRGKKDQRIRWNCPVFTLLSIIGEACLVSRIYLWRHCCCAS